MIDHSQDLLRSCKYKMTDDCTSYIFFVIAIKEWQKQLQEKKINLDLWVNVIVYHVEKT